MSAVARVGPALERVPVDMECVVHVSHQINEQPCQGSGMMLIPAFILLQHAVSANCGATSSENCTYVESQGSETGDCTVSICKCNSNICQLRLDFNTFLISGPSTSSLTVGKLIAATEYTLRGTCQTDRFSVTSPGNPTPPVICGSNAGEHSKLFIAF